MRGGEPSGLPILHGTVNYNRWKQPMLLYLLSKRLGGYIDGTKIKPEVKSEEWIAKDSQAKLYIYYHLSQKIRNTLDMERTAKDVWDYLQNRYSTTEPDWSFYYFDIWKGLRYDGKTDIDAFIQKFDAAFNDAKNAGYDFGKKIDKRKKDQLLKAIEGIYPLHVTTYEMSGNEKESSYEALTRHVLVWRR